MRHNLDQLGLTEGFFRMGGWSTNFFVKSQIVTILGFVAI